MAGWGRSCEASGIDVEDLISDVAEAILRRGNYDPQRSAPSTYFTWITRSVWGTQTRARMRSPAVISSDEVPIHGRVPESWRGLWGQARAARPEGMEGEEP